MSVVVVDFENDSVRTSLEVARHSAKKLWGVRLDTSELLVDRSLWNEMGDARRPRDRRDQHHRTARRARAADRQRPGRGGERPVLLLNGQRISGFRELRDIPTEAISGSRSCPRKSRSNTATAPTRRS